MQNTSESGTRIFNTSFKRDVHLICNSSESSNNQFSFDFIERQWKDLDKVKFYSIGGAFSFITLLGLYPLDLIKTRIQVYSTNQNATSATSKYQLGNFVRDIYKQEGVRGFFKGFTTVLTGNIASEFFYFTAFEIARQNIHHLYSKSNSTVNDFIADGAAGVCAEVASNFVIVPFDIISQRLMIQGGYNQLKRNQAEMYKGGIDAAKVIYRTEGIRGFYKGFGASIASLAPESALWWSVYGQLKKEMYKRFAAKENSNTEKQHHIHDKHWIHFVSGCITGATTSWITTPLDVVKTRIQTQDYSEKLSSEKLTKHKTFLHALRDIPKQEGYQALFRGAQARTLYSTFVSGISITVYEFVKQLSEK